MLLIANFKWQKIPLIANFKWRKMPLIANFKMPKIPLIANFRLRKNGAKFRDNCFFTKFAVLFCLRFEKQILSNVT